ncbi:MAG: hypothetical protein JO023_06545 [Chloroflexi bacterium]|nr:hypothetical protein [Chloroflexota bacterium]
MRKQIRLALGALAASAIVLGPAAAASADDGGDHDGHVVFVQTNDLNGNHVLAFDRAADGRLNPGPSFATGGKGGALQGAAADHLASQGSLVYDPTHQLLIGVNAGSNSVYSAHVDGNRLSGLHVVDAGGLFPVSVTVHEELAYVLNAEGAGSVSGYRVDRDGLSPIPGSVRSLGLTPVTGPTQFVNTPGQVSFTPDGEELLVTTKANGSHIDAFQVRPDGRLSTAPVVTTSTTPVPFGVQFNRDLQLVVAEAGGNALSTYRIGAAGVLSPLGSLTDGQLALCWVEKAEGFFYVANPGSGTLSGYRIDASGKPSLLGATGVVASPGGGPIDLAATRSGHFLYVQLGVSGNVAGYKVNEDGSLTSVGTVTGLPGMEGIVAL